MQIITEQSIKIKASLPTRDATKKQEIFYNPLMVSNRNISINLINQLDKDNFKIALPLSGSGVRGLRFLKELKQDKIKEIHFNDIKEGFINTMESNLDLNNLKKENTKIHLHNQDANLFMLTKDGFDYIDLDPFGSPNPFLATAISQISRGGILAVTATDTAALTGTYSKVTRRKYWSRSMKNYMMHETGLRILIRKVQLQGVQFDKALTPILSYHKDHYFRVYFRSDKGKKKCDDLIKQHQYFLYCNNCLNFKSSDFNHEICMCKNNFISAGPLWSGRLYEKELISKISANNPFPEEQKFLDSLLDESKLDVIGFYDLHVLSKKFNDSPKETKLMLKLLNGQKTHFSLYGIKSDLKIEEVKKRFIKNKKE